HERRNRRQRQAELRLGALRIEGRAPARVESLAGDLERAALVLRVVPRDRELLLRAPQIEVGPRDLRRERHLDVPQILAGRSQERALCLDVAADPPEEIELPGGVEPAVPD